jgi:DNA repair protein RadC
MNAPPASKLRVIKPRPARRQRAAVTCPAQLGEPIVPLNAHVPIRDWPRHQRPREKLLREGAATLSDSELLAIVLRIGVPGQSAVELGHALLVKFGSIQALMSAQAKQLRAVRGIGPAKQTQLQAALELAKRMLSPPLRDSIALDSPGAVYDYLRLLLAARAYEAFVCLYLDSRNRLIRIEESSRGTLTHTAVYPREIAREALAHNAAALIVAHNHPSGDARPSNADRHLTQRLKSTLELLDVRLLDHLIIGSGGVFSFAEGGLL